MEYLKNNNKIIVDSRMSSASGIGTYLKNAFVKIYNIKNFIIEDITIELPIYSLKEQFLLPFKIKDSNLYLSPHYNVPLLPIRANKRMVTIHDVFHLAYFHTLSIKQKIYAKIMINAAVRISDQIITVSEFSKSEIIKYTGIKQEKINVIYNGVDFNQFKIIDELELKNHIIQKYSLPSQYLLYVGNVKPHKNLKGLIEAYQLTEKTKASYHLVIVGKKEGFITGDNEIDQLIEKYNLTNKIHFTGYVEEQDLTVIYNLAAWFVFPSLYEGFGLPPLEAMACGTPVIASNIPVFHEIYQDAYVAADTQSPQAFAEILDQAVSDDDLRKSLIQKGLNQCKKYTWEKSAQKHVELIQKMIS